MVWRQDFPQWIPASQVPELMTILNSIHAVNQMPPYPSAPSSSGYQSASTPHYHPYSQDTPNATYSSHNSVMSRPDNYMVWAILSTVLCCVPFGIPAIVYASKVNGLWDQHKYSEAKNASDKAKMWTLITVGCGFVAGIIGFLVGLAGL